MHQIKTVVASQANIGHFSLSYNVVDKTNWSYAFMPPAVLKRSN
jgi:hypothetical protein